MKGVSTGRVVSFVVLAAIGCAADLATKSWMFNRLGLPGGDTWWLWPQVCGFQTSLNEGALFGVGQGKVWLFASLSIAAATAILYWLFVIGAAHDGLLTFALGCVTAGILGNLYDRLGLWWTPADAGYPRYAVRDWILFQYKGWVWPNFNIADSLLVCGAALLVVHAWLTPTPTPALPISPSAHGR